MGSTSVTPVIAQDDGDNKVIFYYQKPAEPEPEPEPEPSGGSGSGSSNEPTPPSFIIDNDL